MNYLANVNVIDLVFDTEHGGRVKRLCLQCGKTFMSYSSDIKRGKAKFCSNSCTTTFRNIRDNPAKRPEVREKIKLNHADISGRNNPMYGRRGRDAPSFIDGRGKYAGDAYRGIALANKPAVCEVCGVKPKGRKLHIHHKDENHNNNELSNLMILCVKCHNSIMHLMARDSKGCFIKKEVMAQCLN